MNRSYLRNKWIVALVAVGVSFGLGMTFLSTRSSAHSSPRANLTTKAIGPRIKPRAVQARLDALNAAYDRCMQGHGASRIDYGDGGWTYGTNPSAQTTCKGDLDVIEAYTESAAYRASDATSHKLLTQFWACVDALATKDDAGVQGCADRASYHD